MSALGPDALAGLDVGYTGGGPVRALAGGLAELGARIASDDSAVDLLLVPLHGRPRAVDPRASAADEGHLEPDGSTASLDPAANGTLASELTAAFAAARDGASRLRPGGCLLFVLSPADPIARAALASLTRTLALEWAPSLRVNALACARPADAVDLAALIAWRASRTFTGAVLDAS